MVEQYRVTVVVPDEGEKITTKKQLQIAVDNILREQTELPELNYDISHSRRYSYRSTKEAYTELRNSFMFSTLLAQPTKPPHNSNRRATSAMRIRHLDFQAMKRAHYRIYNRFVGVVERGFSGRPDTYVDLLLAINILTRAGKVTRVSELMYQYSACPREYKQLINNWVYAVRKRDPRAVLFPLNRLLSGEGAFMCLHDLPRGLDMRAIKEDLMGPLNPIVTASFVDGDKDIRSSHIHINKMFTLAFMQGVPEGFTSQDNLLNVKEYYKRFDFAKRDDKSSWLVLIVF